MKSIFTSVLLFFAIQLCFGQNSASIDSVLIDKVDSLVGVSNDLLNASYTDSARQIANHVLQFSTEANYEIGIGQAYAAIANIYSMNGDNAKAIEYSKMAADIFEKNAAYRKMTLVHYNMGVELYNDGQYETALEYWDMAKVFLLKENDRKMLIGVNGNIGAVYIRLKKPLEQTLSVLNEAEEMAREDSNMASICHILNNKGIAYVKARKNLDEAINVFFESTRLQQQEGIENDFTKGYSYSGLSEAFFYKGKYDLALVYNDTALLTFKRLKYPLGLKSTYETRKDIYASKGDYRHAFETLETLNLLKDTLYDEQRSKQISQVRTQYETEKKETEIASLSQQASIQALEIQHKNQVIIIGLVVVLFVLSVTYLIYRQRSLKNQQSQIELEQRFLRSQLNPHFISNALLAVQNFMLKNQADKAALYLAKFSKLMREILENSRQEFILVEDEIEMLTNYMDIHKLRMNDAFDYKIVMDENIDPESDTIPPMFVQPFVENAIEHGIINGKSDGLIELNFAKKGAYISIEIKDNGEGLSSNSQKTQDHTSLSTIIIKERMELFNKSLKNKIQLLLSDHSNEQGEILGAKVELKVPFSYL